MTDTTQATQPTSWLGFKLINQAAADAMGASVLPSDKSLSGPVWVALTDEDGDALYVAGKVVGVTFTASAVRYSVAFPVAPQPAEGVTMYAVVDDIESGIVLAELPEDETVFDAVLTEDAANLLPVAKAERVPSLEPGEALSSAPVLDSANLLAGAQLEGELTERLAALQSSIASEDDPMGTVAIARDVIGLAQQVAAAPAVEPEQADPLASARARLDSAPFKKLTNDFISSLSVIKGVDEGRESGWDRSLFVNSIAGKIKTQAKNDPELAGMLLAWLDKAQSGWAKPAITARNGVWASVAGWERYKPLFGGAAPEPVTPTPDPAPTGPSEQFESYRAHIEEQRVQGKAIPAGMLEQIRRDERLNDGEADQLEALAATAAAEVAAVDPEPAAVEPTEADGNPFGLTDAEMVVLISLQSYAASGRVANVMRDSGITKEQYDAAFKSLLQKPGFMSMGKITPDGTAIVRAFMPGMLANKKLEAMRTRFVAMPSPAELEPAPDATDTTDTTDTSGGTTSHNPQRAADMAFLNGVISASTDMWADDLEGRIEAMATTYEGDDEVMALWGQAIQAYTDFMVAAMG